MLLTPYSAGATGAAGIGAGFRLGQGEAGDQVAGGHTRKPFRLLLLGAEQDKGLRADADIRARNGAEGR